MQEKIERIVEIKKILEDLLTRYYFTPDTVGDTPGIEELDEKIAVIQLDAISR